MVYSARRFALSFALCYFVLVFFSPFSIAITSLGEERANLGAFRAFVRFAFVLFCLFSLPLRVWDGLRLVIVAFPGLFAYLFCTVLSIKRLVCWIQSLAGDIFKYFPQEMGISFNEMSNCIFWEILYSGKNQKHIINLTSAEFNHSTVSFNIGCTKRAELLRQ